MQKYSNTTESPKLSIDTTVTKTEWVKKEITLPYYFKHEGYFCKVVSAELFIQVDNSSNWWGTYVRPVKHYLSNISNGTPITEDEFDTAYENALMYVQSLKENLDPSNEPDENVQIDEMLYDQR